MSPPKSPEIVTLAEVGVNVTAHPLVVSVQLFEPNVPDPAVTVNVTVPAGVLTVPGALSVTLAVQLVT